MPNEGNAMSSTADGQWKTTACILCENNCGIQVQAQGRRFVKIRDDKEHVSSHGYTCNKALRLDHYQNGGRRTPLPPTLTPSTTNQDTAGSLTARDRNLRGGSVGLGRGVGVAAGPVFPQADRTGPLWQGQRGPATHHEVLACDRAGVGAEEERD